MRRSTTILKSVFATLTLACVTSAWWGCSTTPDQPSTGTGDSTSTGSGGKGGSGVTVGPGGTGGAGGMDIDIDGGPMEEAGACTSTSQTAHPIKLDIIFLIDQSGSMSGAKWSGTTSALKTFFKDPASANIGAGMT